MLFSKHVLVVTRRTWSLNKPTKMQLASMRGNKNGHVGPGSAGYGPLFGETDEEWKMSEQQVIWRKPWSP